ncbi:O-antigen polymerase [Pseudoalteromonas sp. SR41-1]|uniref:O-antigen polymerase n=1 Tax=Pseudoalteromonas sp. SR41-1 TaxID=2760952 RepID=UPI0016029FDC|nr:O-antigen polymerase [Pseudoalteromonas sp. SR41-1]MBB1279840.1 oligosaccharide repeat unit polymerase [Pseudoalteromonas sp. SR41-1]
MILIFLFFFFIALGLDRSNRKIISLSLAPLIFLMSISFITIGSADTELFLYQAKPSLTESYYYLFILSCMFFVTSIILSNFIIGKDSKSLKQGLVGGGSSELKIITRLFFITSFISFIAFVYNLNSLISHAMSSSAFNARGYEKAFGSESIVNYFYFFHMISIFCYSLIKFKYKENIRYGKIIVLVMIFSAICHGIKFTVYDVIVPSLILYYLYADKIRIRFLLSVIGLFIVFLWLFFTYVRGASEEVTWYQALFNYVIPNYYNLMFVIESHGINSDYGFSLWYPPKLPKPEGISEVIMVTEGFQLNFRYNMYTALNAGYRVFGVFAGVILLVAAFFTAWSYKGLSRFGGVIYTFIFSICILSNSLMFYYWTYNKLKYWWLITAVIGIVFILRLRLKKQ